MQIVDVMKARKFHNNEVGDILRSCSHKISNLQNYKVQFVSSQVNQVAHTLVRTSRSFACMQFFDHSPTYIEHFILGDLIYIIIFSLKKIMKTKEAQELHKNSISGRFQPKETQMILLILMR